MTTREKHLKEMTTIRIAKDRTCDVCKKVFKRSKKQRVYYCCQECHEIGSMKIKWPQPVELLELVRSTSFSQVGRDFGVSDHSVRKRLKRAGLLNSLRT